MNTTNFLSVLKNLFQSRRQASLPSSDIVVKKLTRGKETDSTASGF